MAPAPKNVIRLALSRSAFASRSQAHPARPQDGSFAVATLRTST
jgi:hypothetical protein